MSYEDDMLRVPSKAMFTDIAGGAATTADVKGGISITHAADASVYAIYGMDVAVPSAPYTMTAKMDFNGSVPQSSLSICGILLSNGTSLETLGLVNNNGAGVYNIFVSDWTSRASVASSPSVLNAPWFSSGMWLRVADDNANRTWSISKDGVSFTTLYSVARTSYITPTRIGFFVTPHSAAPQVTLTSWHVT